MSNVWLCFTCDEPAGVCECEGPPMRFTNRHLSDCAVHNEPAYPNGLCDCGVETSAATLHGALTNEGGGQ